jgi:YidC/Oxa1 family membrane protein insertase
MTPNQRLMLAVALSVGFFALYTSIFPPQLEHEVSPQTSDSSTLVVQDSTIASKQGSAEVQKDVASSTIVSVKSDKFTLEVDTLGRISSKKLLQEKYSGSDDAQAELISQDGHMPLFIRFAEPSLNEEASKVAYSSDISSIVLKENDAARVVLTQQLSNLLVKKEIVFHSDGHYDVSISMSEDKKYFIYLGSRPQITKKLLAAVGAIVYTPDNDLVTIVEDGDANEKQIFQSVGMISAFDQYLANLMYGFSKDTIITLDRDRKSNPVVYFEGSKNIKFNGYLGPKDYKVLNSINPMLTNAIEYGWFTFAAKPLFRLLSFLHGIFGNWGWAIIGLTIIVRIVMFPLTHKGMVSMQKIKQIAPQMKELQAKYKGDPQRLNAAMMDMYKKHGANPLGGCFPMLLQIPIFFAIYRVLLNAVELQGAEWMFWVNDLSRMDPTFILPLLMGASMYYQQKLTPSNFTDPLQEKIFKFLPVIFTFFFITFPSGLVLYWFVNNLFSIAQQFIVNRQFKSPAKEVATK